TIRCSSSANPFCRADDPAVGCSGTVAAEPAPRGFRSGFEACLKEQPWLVAEESRTARRRPVHATTYHTKKRDKISRKTIACPGKSSSVRRSKVWPAAEQWISVRLLPGRFPTAKGAT